jgi:type IV secretion system protein VirB2
MRFIKMLSAAKSASVANSAAMAEQNRKTLGVLAIGALAFLAMSPELALASPWDSAATKVLEIFTGGFARTLAIIAVIACGIAAIAGKLSWDWAIKIIIGIVLIFGATSIVDYVIAGTS